MVIADRRLMVVRRRGAVVLAAVAGLSALSVGPVGGPVGHLLDTGWQAGGWQGL